MNLAQASQAAGGKAYTLGRLLAGGFCVPPGYCVFPGTETAEFVAAWRALGGGAVAVRSLAVESLRTSNQVLTAWDHKASA